MSFDASRVLMNIPRLIFSTLPPTAAMSQHPGVDGRGDVPLVAGGSATGLDKLWAAEGLL